MTKEERKEWRKKYNRGILLRKGKKVKVKKAKKLKVKDQKEYRQRKRTKWNAFLLQAGLLTCIICGSNSKICFHHPHEKKIKIGNLKVQALESGISELKKTVPLCASCHAKLHAAKQTNEEWDSKISVFYDDMQERELVPNGL
jgi:hypothetical protein